jgi:hypothetical protein
MQNEMFELADRFKILKESKKEAEEALKAINTELEQVELKLAELMVNEETQSFNRSGTLFYLITKTYASAIGASKEQLHEALRQNGYGSLIYETVNANSLSAFVKEQIAENGDELPDWLKGLVNVFEKTTVTVRKAAR